FSTTSPLLVGPSEKTTTTPTQPTARTTSSVTGTPAFTQVGKTANTGAGSPLAASASKAILLSGNQRGTSVHGSVDIASAGSGGHLEVDLFTSSASLAKAG